MSDYTHQRPMTCFFDTNVLVKEPNALYDYLKDPETTVIIPEIVLKELDGLKRKPHIRENVYAMLRLLEQLSRDGDLMNGVPLPLRRRNGEQAEGKTGGKIRFYSHRAVAEDTQLAYDPNTGNDMELIQACRAYAKGCNDKEEVMIVSGDINLVTIARSNGLKAEYKELNTGLLYKGYLIVEDTSVLEKLVRGRDHQDSYIEIEALRHAYPWADELIGNQYMVIADARTRRLIEEDKPIDLQNIFRYRLDERKLRGISPQCISIGKNIRARNLEQMLAIDSLLAEDIKVTVLVGVAGGGKSYLALAAALHKVIQARKGSAKGDDEEVPKGRRRDLQEMQPTVHLLRCNTLTESIGYLPGGVEDKVAPLYGSAEENWLEIAQGLDRGGVTIAPSLEAELISTRPLVIREAYAYLRGRTIRDIMLIEEAQNFEPEKIKFLLTRAGEGKVYITGDVRQTDNSEARSDYNGASELVNKIVKKPGLQRRFNVIAMRKCIRSEVASLAEQEL